MNILKYRNIAILLVLVVGIAITSFTSWLFYNIEQKAITEEFHNEVDQKVSALNRELVINLEVLYSLSILFQQDNIPTFKQFSSEAKRILNRHKDIQALEWIPKVAHNKRSSFEAKQRSIFLDFEFIERKKQGQMITAKKRKEYYPVYYVEPHIGNEAALGFDLASSAIRLKTLEYSRDTANPQITSSITLVQESKNQKGFLAFLPIYIGNPSTVLKRQQRLIGFVLGVYRISDIYKSSTHNNIVSDINVKLIDETNPSNPDILYISTPNKVMNIDSEIFYKKYLPELWGRKWAIIATPSSSYYSSKMDYKPFIIFIIGFIFAILIAIYIYIVSNKTKSIEKEVLKRTEELREANIQLEVLSHTDGLTNIYNRRYLNDYLHREWSRSIRDKTPISFILLDVDCFKLYNDNYGHQKGDECLQKIAEVLNTLVRRSTDIVARYGGEEFAIVLVNTQDAQYMSEKVRQHVEDLQIPHKFSSVSDVITISLGFYTLIPNKGTEYSLIIENADKALYKAKQEGKNRVEIFKEYP